MNKSPEMLNENQKSLILPHQNLSVAQLVEQLTLNQWVVGSNPTGETENETLTRIIV